MYAAGYLEGAITAERIYQQYNNMDQILFRDVTNETISKLKTFFLQQVPYWLLLTFIAL
jgi:hypothetical protein